MPDFANETPTGDPISAFADQPPCFRESARATVQPKGGSPMANSVSSRPGEGRVRVDVIGAVGELVLNRPPLNLFDVPLVGEFEAALQRLCDLAAAGRVRAVLFRAEGQIFCGGVDVHEFKGLDAIRGSLLMARLLGLTKSIEGLPVPSVAAVHGLNLTIGFELSLACDMLWAANDVSFGLVEATVGLTPGAGGTQRLVARAGAARTAELIMTGNLYPATELHAWGVINRLRSPAELLPDVRAFAASLAAGPTAATRQGKLIIQTAGAQGTAAADAITPRVVGEVFPTEDLKTGISALLDKRPRPTTFLGH